MNTRPTLPPPAGVLLAATILACAFGVSRAGEAEFDESKFAFLGSKPLEKVIETVGEPAARYKDLNHEYLLYPNAVRVKDGVRSCCEVMFSKGKMTQINYLPEEVMKKSVEVVKGFGDWKPPEELKLKSFPILGTHVVGKTKVELVEILGQPDVKRVFNGMEVWDYQKVPMEKGSEKLLTLFVEFEGDKVSGTKGN